MTISKADFWICITELVTRNPNLGIPALEDVFFSKFVDFRLLILYICEGKRERGITCIVVREGVGGQTPLQNCSGW